MTALIWICVGFVIAVITIFLIGAYFIMRDWDGLDYTHEELDLKQEEVDRMLEELDRMLEELDEEEDL